MTARVVELVDAADSKSAAARRAGSIPASGTITTSEILVDLPCMKQGTETKQFQSKKLASESWLFCVYLLVAHV